VAPSNISIEPAWPQASHATASADGRGLFCEPELIVVPSNAQTFGLPDDFGFPFVDGGHCDTASGCAAVLLVDAASGSFGSGALCDF
jgi:hypothetical protein